MDWKTNILRKVIIIDESKAEISDERCTIHSKKLELIDTSIQETGVSLSRMAGERNKFKNDAFSRDLGINISYLQNAENFASDEDFDMFRNVNSNGENMEAGDDCRIPRSADASVSFDENSSLCVSESDSSSNCNENNDNIVSEKYELDCSNEDKENNVGDISSGLQTAGTLGNFNENLDFSASTLSNFPNHIENANQTGIDNGNIGQNKIFKSPAKSLKNFEVEQIKFLHTSRNKKNRSTFTETSTETKLDNPHIDDAYGVLFPNNPNNEENMTGYSEANVFLESGASKVPSISMSSKNNVEDNKRTEVVKKSFHNASKIPVLSKNKTTKYNVDDSKRTEVVMKGLYNKRDPLSKQNETQTNMKKYDLYISRLLENGMRRKQLDKETVCRSVTDLITYFENLNTLKQSNVKSEMKKMESQEGLQNYRILKINRIINSSTSSSPSTLRISEIGPKTNKRKEPVLEDIFSEENSGDSKGFIAPEVNLRHGKLGDRKRPTENFQSDVKSGDAEGSVASEASLRLKSGNRKRSIEIVQENNLSDENSGDRKKSIDEKSPEDNVLDPTLGVRKQSIQTFLEKIPFDFNMHRGENLESSMAKLQMCVYCEGKCVHCEQIVNHTEDNANKVKEHVFVFSDDMPKQSVPPITLNARRFRSRFTHKHDLACQQSLRNLDCSKKDVKSTSDFNKTEGSGGFLTDNLNETAVKVSLCDGSLNILPLMQNAIGVTHEKTRCQEKHQEQLSDEKKQKLPCNSVGSSYVKRFIGILFTAMIIAMIYKRISEIFGFC